MCATFFHNFGWAENCRLCSRAKVKLASIKLPFFFQKKYPLFKGKSPWTFDSRKTFLFTTVFENLHKCLIWIFTQKFKFKPSLKINAKLIFFWVIFKHCALFLQTCASLIFLKTVIKFGFFWCFQMPRDDSTRSARECLKKKIKS